jgi:upstream activation factor subunit UAF30
MPSRLTLAQIEDMLARDEAQLEAYRHAAAEAAADGLDPGHTHGLARCKLEKVFGKEKVTMFEMNKHLAQHLK